MVLDGTNSVLGSNFHSDSEYYKDTFFFAVCQIALVVSNSIWLLPIWLEPINIVIYVAFLFIRSMKEYRKTRFLHGIVIAGIAVCTVRYLLNHQLIAGESIIMYGVILALLLALGLAGFLLTDDVFMSVWYIVGAAIGAYFLSEDSGSLANAVFCNLVWFQICIVQVWTTCTHIFLRG